MGITLKTASATSLAKVARHFDNVALSYDTFKKKNIYYYDTIKAFVRRNVRPQSKVLEVGCATGEILACVQPAQGVGIDLSPKLIDIAAKKFPQYRFLNTSLEDFPATEKFDYIILVDVIHHVHDVMTVFEKIHALCHERTKVIVTVINPWWEPVLRVLEKLKIKMPDMPLNYFERRTVRTVMDLLDFSVTQMGTLLLVPFYIPLFSYLANTIGVRLPGFNKLSFVQYMIIQPMAKNTTDLGMGCSVVIPCYNEEGNIVEAIERIPAMGKGTEIIVVNDGSKDRTAERVRGLQNKYSNLKLIDYSPNEGKGAAVKKGFDAATQEIVMILDADMTVVPEELPRFFDPLNKGLCRFVNGTRFLYPKENQSMRFLNQLGNKMFSLIVSFIINQNLTDTLCGTKALYKKDYKSIRMGQDRWGDYDLILGSAKMGNRILEVPVHYMSRKAGQSKMQSFRHTVHLLKVCLFWFHDFAFVPEKPAKRLPDKSS